LNYKKIRTAVVFVLRVSKYFTQAAADRYLVTSELPCCKALAKVTALDVSLPGMRFGRVWCHGRRTVRGPPRSPHSSMAIISVTV